MFLIKSSKMNTLQWMSFPIASLEWQNKVAVSGTPPRAAPHMFTRCFPWEPSPKAAGKPCAAWSPCPEQHPWATTAVQWQWCSSGWIQQGCLCVCHWNPAWLQPSGCLGKSARAQQLKLPWCPCARGRDGNRGRPLGVFFRTPYRKIPKN